MSSKNEGNFRGATMKGRLKARLRHLVGIAIDYVYSNPALRTAARRGKRLLPGYVHRRMSRFSQARRRALILHRGRDEVPENAVWILRALDQQSTRGR